MPTRTGIDPDFDFDFDRDNDRTDRQPLAGGGRHVLFSLVQEVDFFGLLFLIELLLWSMVWALMQPFSRIQSGIAAERNRCVWARGMGSALAEGCDARCLVLED
jgi:hypothetical protein